MADLQSDIKIGANAIGGSLAFVDDYTGFSGDARLQSGHFLVVHCDTGNVTADRITVQVLNGEFGPATLDEDGIAILRIKDANAQAVQVVAYKDGYAASKLFDLSGLTLEPAED